ncbi:50S ribosomal protein L19 [Patescibacteria group bacterium]
MANQAQLNETVFRVGDSVRVHQKIIEGEKERIYVFEGIVISIRGSGENKSFTVRRIAAGNIGVERIWPLSSPWLVKIDVLKHGKVRRAKLYYLRDRVGRKATRVRTRKVEPEPKKVSEKKAKPDAKKTSQGKAEKGEAKTRGNRRGTSRQTPKK